MIYKAGARVSTVTPYDGVVGQSAAARLQRVRVIVGASAGTFGVEARHGIHTLVPSMPSMVIAARLGPAKERDCENKSLGYLILRGNI